MRPEPAVGRVTLCFEGRVYIRLWAYFFDCTRQVVGVDRRIGAISIDVPGVAYGSGAN